MLSREAGFLPLRSQAPSISCLDWCRYVILNHVHVTTKCPAVLDIWLSCLPSSRGNVTIYWVIFCRFLFVASVREIRGNINIYNHTSAFLCCRTVDFLFKHQKTGTYITPVADRKAGMTDPTRGV